MRKAEEYFLRIVASSEDLPASVAERIRHHPALRPEKMILAPSQEYAIVRQNRLFSIKFGRRITPDRTLVFGDDQLLVIEKQRDSTFNEIVIPFGDLVHIELAVILLYGYVCFNWIADDALRTLKIEYNGVRDLLMRAEVERLRRRLYRPEGSAVGMSYAEWVSVLQAMPLKFANYLQYALFAGEPVLSAIFQPAIEPPQRSRLPENRALALTAGWLIVLEEAREVANFGVVIRYFPIAAVGEIRFELASDRVWLRVGVGASGLSEVTAIPLSARSASSLSDALQRFTPSIPVRWVSEAAHASIVVAR